MDLINKMDRPGNNSQSVARHPIPSDVMPSLMGSTSYDTRRLLGVAILGGALAAAGCCKESVQPSPPVHEQNEAEVVKEKDTNNSEPPKPSTSPYTESVVCEWKGMDTKTTELGNVSKGFYDAVLRGQELPVKNCSPVNKKRPSVDKSTPTVFIGNNLESEALGMFPLNKGTAICSMTAVAHGEKHPTTRVFTLPKGKFTIVTSPLVVNVCTSGAKFLTVSMRSDKEK